MSVDIAGPYQVGEGVNPRIRYAPHSGPTPTYSVRGRQRERITVRREGGLVVIRDIKSGVAAEGSTYLDALQAFQKARRGK